MLRKFITMGIQRRREMAARQMAYSHTDIGSQSSCPDSVGAEASGGWKPRHTGVLP